MKTLYLTAGNENIAVDHETEEVTHLKNEDRYMLRSVYYLEEPMHVVYGMDGEKEELDAKKGDLVLLFYHNRINKHRIATIKCPNWVKNIKAQREEERRAEEEWAKKKAECNGECPSCDN